MDERIVIKSTIEYDKFQNILGNRDVREVMVKRLMISMREKNQLHLRPILVNEKLEVIDGQHRLEAARRIMARVYYQIEKGLTLADAERLNFFSDSKWTAADVLNKYVKLGYKDYEILNSFVVSTGLGVMILAKMLEGKTVSHKGSRAERPTDFHKKFRQGNFQIADGAVKATEEKVALLMRLRPYCEGNFWKTSDFLRAMELRDVEKLLYKLKTFNKTLSKQENLRRYLFEFDEIINFRSQKLHSDGASETFTSPMVG